MAKPQEIAFQKCRCFGGPFLLVHFSENHSPSLCEVRLEGRLVPGDHLCLKRAASLDLQRAVLLVVHGLEPFIAGALAGELESQVT